MVFGSTGVYTVSKIDLCSVVNQKGFCVFSVCIDVIRSGRKCVGGQSG